MRSWLAPVEPVAGPLKALVARGVVPLALILFGAGSVFVLNWWNSPKHQIQFATDAATRAPSERQTQAEQALGQALGATSVESSSAGTCPREVCYVSVCRTWFRAGERVRGKTLELQARTEACVEAWVGPVITSPMTSRSRRLSEAYRSASARFSSSSSRAARLRSIAFWIVPTSTSSSKGLVRNSKAPAFIARTVMGMSP